MDGEDGDRIRIGIEVCSRWVVPGVDEGLEVPSNEDRPIVGQEAGLRSNDVEEAGHIAEGFVTAVLGCCGESREEPAVPEERIQDLACRPFGGQRAVAREVPQEPAHGLPRSGGNPQEARLVVQLIHHLPDGPITPPGQVDDRGQVVTGDPVQVGCRQGIHVHARVEIRDGSQEGHQQADLGPGVESRRTGESPWDAGQVECPQDGIGVAVGPDEHGMVPRPRPGAQPSGDVGGDPVRLLRSRGERLEPDRRCGRILAYRPKPFRDPGSNLESIRIVEPDKPVRRVQDRRERPVVPAQDDSASVRVASLEVQDVVDGRSAEGIDRLVVVSHHGDVAMRLRDESDQLCLRPVGVLEFIHQHVAISLRDGRTRRRGLAHQPECERDLVPEVDEPVPGQQVLVGRIGAGELHLTAPILGQGRCRVRARPWTLAAVGRGLRDALRLGPDPLGVVDERRRRDVLVLATAEQGGERGEESRRVAEGAVLVEVEVIEVLAQEDHDLGPAQHAQVRRQTQLKRELPDEPVTERVERRDLGIRIAVRDELVHADRHLVGSLVREREGQDLRRSCLSGRDQPGDPAGDHLRLAGAGPGDDEHGPVAVGDRAFLVPVEPLEQGLHAHGDIDAGGGWVHDGHEFAPRGDLLERRRLTPARA